MEGVTMNNKTKNHLNNYCLYTIFVFLLTLAVPAGAAEQRGSDFDHLRTGFSLRGAHARVECQTCHVQGVFKGTPTQCERCHIQGSRMAESFKPANHVPTGLACDQCHTNTVSWAGARYRHTGVAPGSCLQCHNGSVAPGKSANHMQTNASCDSCHRTTAWIPARVDHSMFAPGSCLQCHASQKPNDSTHAGVTASCDTCHSTRGPWSSGAKFNHANAVPNGCLACHGSTAKAKPPAHIPAPMSCDACHNTTTFNSSTMRSHTASQGVVTGGCLSCHISAYDKSPYDAKAAPPSKHTTAARQGSCDGSGCHTTKTFSK
jgi:hypothetical protein